MSTVRALPGSQAIAMVAAREISTRTRTKAFVIGNLIILSAIAGGLILASVLQGHFGKPPKIGLVGPASSLSAPLKASAAALDKEIRLQGVGTEAQARALLDDGELKVALVRKGTGYLALTQKRVAPDVQGVLTTAIRQEALNAALMRQRVNAGMLAADMTKAKLTIDAVDPPKPDADQRTALAFAAVSLLYMQLFGNGIAVASGVVEEKTSRVVELLLAAIKPLHLLVGKIVGIGVVGLLQLAAYAVVGLVVGTLTGLLSVSGAVVAVFASTLGWYLLGFAFLGVLYAAAGSMVSRQEEIGSTTGPLSILVIGMFGVAQATVQSPDGTLANVMSWIPPFSAVLMPLRIAAGVAGPAQIIGTVVLMLASASVLAVVSARVYQRSILRMGSRVGWKQAFGRG